MRLLPRAEPTTKSRGKEGCTSTASSTLRRLEIELAAAAERVVLRSHSRTALSVP
jgi:hypothetical protein